VAEGHQVGLRGASRGSVAFRLRFQVKVPEARRGVAGSNKDSFVSVADSGGIGVKRDGASFIAEASNGNQRQGGMVGNNVRRARRHW